MEMVQFFDGLGCKLRVSGMVADSIMIGIVNSAMEEAFDNACFKEGDIERLNEKSRFCELAVMQLEWCLKFVQEETDSIVVESSCEREKLVSDLTETRDRLQRRLEETELAISEKDRELTERFENEMKLRQALELKDRELSSLHFNLKLERTKCEDGDEGMDGDICELKNSVDQQFWNIKQQLEDERINLSNEMRILSQWSSNAVNFEPDSDLLGVEICESSDRKEIEFLENDKGHEIETPDCSLKPELNIGFEKMGSDIDILKETLDLAFGMMDNAISLSEVRPMEQQWRWVIEKDTIGIMLKGFLRDIQENFETKVKEGRKQVPLDLLGRSWSDLMAEITNLHLELEFLVNQTVFQGKAIKDSDSATIPSQIDVGCQVISQRENPLRGKPFPKSDCGSSARDRYHTSNNASEKVEELDYTKETPKEDPAGHRSHFVAEMIRNHESFIRQRSEELNWLKGEILKEKGSSYFGKDRASDSLKNRIHGVILRLDSVLKESAKLHAIYGDCRCIHEDKLSLPYCLSMPELANNEAVAICTFAKVPEKVDNVSVHYSIDADLREESRQLKQEREELSLQNMIMEEIYLILFRELVKEIHLELCNNYDLENFIREDICKVFFRKMVEEWSKVIENHIKEGIYHIVFREPAKDFDCTYSFTFTECQEARGELNYLEDSSSNNLLQNLDYLIREDLCTVYLREMVKEWNKDIESYNIEDQIREKIYRPILSETVTEIGCTHGFTLTECQDDRDEGNFMEDSHSSCMFQNLEGLIREDVCAVFLREMVKEWNKNMESYKIESHIREEIYNFVSSESVIGRGCTHGFTLTECQEDMNKGKFLNDSPPTNNLFQNLEDLIREDVCAVFLQEMVKEWNKFIESYYMENDAREEIHQIVFNEVVKDIVISGNFALTECKEAVKENYLEDLSSSNKLLHSLDCVVRWDVCTVFFREMVQEWKMEIESYIVGTLIRDEIFGITISEAVKDVNFYLTECQADRKKDNCMEDLPSTNKFQSLEVHEKVNLIQRLDSLSKCFEAEENLIIHVISELLKQYVHLDPVCMDSKALDKGNIHCEGMLIENDNGLGSLSNNLEKALQQIITSKVHLKEMGISLGIAVGDLKQVHDQVTPTEGMIQDIGHAFCLPEKKNAVQLNPLGSISTFPLEFSKVNGDFERMVREKVGQNSLRSEEVQCQLDLLVEHVASLSKKELLYREAFMRRCFDLQKAEAEVDLLGDEVEVLVDLLEKIHVTLDHYSPVLQHYFGIMDILELIRKELSGVGACTLH